MRRKRIMKGTAIGLTALMVMSGAVNPALAGEAATESTSEVHFPDVYTEDLIVPDTNADEVEAKVKALVNAMTEEEKFSFLGGSGLGNVANAGNLPGVPRFGVPEMLMYDGPGGIYYMTDTTNPPEEECLAATWDEEDAYKYGTIYSREAKAIGDGMMLSAQLDIQRTPQFSRTKDQMGADPYLLSSMADDLVNGMQSEGGIAVLKHFVAYTEGNNNAVLSEQALHELYLASFEAAVKNANALGIMSSYNLINGTYASANTYTQNDVLRGMWNYPYFTITDWGGNHEFTMNKGTDIEMPTLTGNAQDRVDSRVDLESKREADGWEPVTGGFGVVAEQTDKLESFTREEADEMIDTAVARVLRAYGQAGYLTLVELNDDGTPKEEAGRTAIIKQVDMEAARQQLAAVADEDNETALQVAQDGIVLLKNDNDVLPLSSEDTAAVVGITGQRLASGVGGERSYGTVSRMTSPLEALKEAMGSDKVDGAVYADTVGTTISNENLYTSADGDEHGVVRTYGTLGTAAEGQEQQGQMFAMGNVEPTDMEGHTTGDIAAIDDVIDYNVGTIDGKPNQTYLASNADEGTSTAFEMSTDPAYTITTYVEPSEDGIYTLAFNQIGAIAKMRMYDTDGKTIIAELNSPNNRQNSQWYTSIVPNEYGMDVENVDVTLSAGQRYKVEIQCTSAVTSKDVQINLSWITPDQKQQNIRDALEAARTHSKVIVFAYRTNNGNSWSSREDVTLQLSEDQEYMINSVAREAHEYGNKVIVVLHNDGPVVMNDWIDNVDGLIEAYYPGQRGGVALARILTGSVNPSGHLAYTIPASDDQTVITYSDEAFAAYQQKADSSVNYTTTNYLEGINTDYKFFDEHDLTPQYDFGYGLSYTTFNYSDLSIVKAPAEGEDIGYDVTFTVTNTGDTAGSDVAQVYLGAANVPDGVQTSKYALAGFSKVKDLQPGESREVTVHVAQRQLSYWYTDTGTPDENGEKWTVATGDRTFYVGNSSDNLELSSNVDVEL